jgi:hypothetical protein
MIAVLADYENAKAARVCDQIARFLLADDDR